MTLTPEELLIALRAVDSSGDELGGDIGTNSYRNPQGPQAADTIERLQVRVGVLEGELSWIAAFAEVRSKDESKVFARVNRGALRNIAARACQLLDVHP